MCPQIQIFPQRLLLANTTEKLLDKLFSLGGVGEIVVVGPSLPKLVPYGPAKGLEVAHEERKRMKVGENKVELTVQTGKIILDVEKNLVNEKVSEIENICNEMMPFGYKIEVGKYLKEVKNE
nr:McrD [uncultured archaeon]